MWLCALEVKIATITGRTPTLFMSECNTSVYVHGWFGPNENENESETIDTQRCRKIDFPYTINLLNKEQMVMSSGNLQLVSTVSAQIMINKCGAWGLLRWKKNYFLWKPAASYVRCDFQMIDFNFISFICNPTHLHLCISLYAPSHVASYV